MKQLPPAGDPKPDILSRATPRDSAPGRSEYPDPEWSATPGAGLLEYWRILRRRRGAVALISFLGALAAFLYTLPQTPIYQARTTIEIHGLNENFLNMRDVNPTSEGNLYYPEYDIQTQVRILQSRTLIERVVKKLDIDSRPLVVNPTRIAAWRRALGLPQPQPVSLREQAVGMAAGNLKVRAQANTRLIEILCDSTEPRLAADFANTLASEFIEQNLEARWKTTQHTGEWLSRQMEDLKIKLEKSEDALQTYARVSGLLFTSEKDNIAEQRLKQLQEELSKAQADRIAKQSRFELASSASPDSLPDVLDSASLKDYQAKLTDLRRQLAELGSSFTPAHPRVQKVQAQIGTIEAALDKERANIVSRIRNDYDSAQRREKLLAAGYGAQARLVSEQAAKVTHYNILKREVDTNRQLYDNMLQRVKEAGIASALRASNVRIVDQAAAPRGPYKPSLLTNTALGLFGGIFFGIVFVVFRERMDRTVQEPGDAAFYLGVPELGLIPSADSDPYRKRRLLPVRPVEESQAGRQDRLALVAYEHKPSALSESFHATVASILFAGQNGDSPRVLVFASAAPREGKTTIVTNLAIALAEIRRRVLLIDADLRRPRLHTVFGLENTEGLADVLRRREPVQAPLNGLLRETDIPGLSVLTAGPADEGDTNLLYSARLSELLALVRRDFDMVLIDTPPMLTMVDARVIARLADAVILVARANHTSRDSLQAACQRFAEDGTPVLGTVLNDWNPKRTSHYGYYKYYDRYKHYYEKSK